MDTNDSTLERCPCCGAARETDAECLLRISRALNRDPNGLIIAEGGLNSSNLARVKVALDFAERPGVVFRAFVENMDYVQINRELY